MLQTENSSNNSADLPNIHLLCKIENNTPWNHTSKEYFLSLDIKAWYKTIKLDKPVECNPLPFGVAPYMSVLCAHKLFLKFKEVFVYKYNSACTKTTVWQILKQNVNYNACTWRPMKIDLPLMKVWDNCKEEQLPHLHQCCPQDQEVSQLMRHHNLFLYKDLHHYHRILPNSLLQDSALQMWTVSATDLVL